MSSAFSIPNILIRKSLCIYIVIDLGPNYSSSESDEEGTELREINIARPNTKQLKAIFQNYYLRYGILCEVSLSRICCLTNCRATQAPRTEYRFRPGVATRS
jgi:hypothetical protein